MDMTAAMELRVKNDQAKAALAATKADLKGVGDAAKDASVDGAKLGPGLSAGGNQASAAVAALEAKLEALRAKLMSVTAAEVPHSSRPLRLLPASLSWKHVWARAARGGGTGCCWCDGQPCRAVQRYRHDDGGGCKTRSCWQSNKVRKSRK